MAPAMPQGAIAVSVPIKAHEIQIGDVITVQRDYEKLPVTHRVIEIRNTVVDAIGSVQQLGPGDLAFTLQGDDNKEPDSSPYILHQARKVIFAAPFAGTAIMIIQSPLGMGLLVILAGIIVVWACWPSKETSSYVSQESTTAIPPDQSLERFVHQSSHQSVPISGDALRPRHAYRSVRFRR